MSATPIDVSRARVWRYAQHLTGGYSANLAGSCTAPITRSMRGRPDPVMLTVGLETDKTVNVDIEVPCRRCEACLKRRAAHWRLRAMAEIELANRTWFGTLTVRPEMRFRLEATARHRLTRQGVIWDDLEPHDRFKETTKCLVREFQLFAKRLRKRHKFRHLLIAEKHKDGFPHLHLLVHEMGEPVRHRELTDQWKLGFSTWKLVPTDEGSRAASYVCKYLSKAMEASVVASLRYGKGLSYSPTAPLGVVVPAAALAQPLKQRDDT